jgi:hypothetical protein
MLALWAGQRQGISLSGHGRRMTGTTIRLTQSTTGKVVSIFDQSRLRLKSVVDKTSRRSTMILTNQKGISERRTAFKRRGGRFAGLDRDAAGARRGTSPGDGERDGTQSSGRLQYPGPAHLGERTTLAEMAIKRVERKERRQRKHAKAVKYRADLICLRFTVRL